MSLWKMRGVNMSKVGNSRRRLHVSLTAGQPDKEVASRAKSFLRLYNASERAEADQTNSWTDKDGDELLTGSD